MQRTAPSTLFDQRGDKDLTPRFSIIIPARNEEENLPRCLAALRAALGTRSHEIVVVVNRCTDDTEGVARREGCRIVHEDAKNLSRIRNAGAAAACGEIVITVDADSIVSPRTFIAIDEALAGGDSVGGGVNILPERWSLGIFLTGLCLLPYILFQRIGGGLFFCAREDLLAIGGFNEQLVSAEDIDFAQRLKRYGRARGLKFSVLFSAPIITSCRKFDRLGDWYFLLRPWKFLSLLGGHNQSAADEVWYDFPREPSPRRPDKAKDSR